jgi:hypothetical protein
MLNSLSSGVDALTVRGFLFPNLPAGAPASAKTTSKQLKKYVMTPVRHGGRTLVLKAHLEKHDEVLRFEVAELRNTPTNST